VLTKVRIKVSDTTYNKFSDDELMYALNEATLLLWRHLSANYSTLTRKVKGYTFPEDHVDAALLPEDFHTLVSLSNRNDGKRSTHTVNPQIFDIGPGNAYRWNPTIEGEHILGIGPVQLIYNYSPREVSLIEDVIDVPDALIPDIVAITSNVATQNMDAARQRAAEAGVTFSQFREYTTPPMRRAFL
jgi:hypothetical protein